MSNVIAFKNAPKSEDFTKPIHDGLQIDQIIERQAIRFGIDLNSPGFAEFVISMNKYTTTSFWKITEDEWIYLNGYEPAPDCQKGFDAIKHLRAGELHSYPSRQLFELKQSRKAIIKKQINLSHFKIGDILGKRDCFDYLDVVLEHPGLIFVTYRVPHDDFFEAYDYRRIEFVTVSKKSKDKKKERNELLLYLDPRDISETYPSSRCYKNTMFFKDYEVVNKRFINGKWIDQTV